jgi:hypothetical protein
MPKVFGGNPDYGVDELNRHGTSMLAALAGATVGVAKSVTVVPVTFNSGAGKQICLDAAHWILEDWTVKRLSLDDTLAPFGVLSLSFGYAANPDRFIVDDWFEFILSGTLKQLGDLGLVQLASAGNNGVSLFFRHPWNNCLH